MSFNLVMALITLFFALAAGAINVWMWWERKCSTREAESRRAVSIRRSSGDGYR